MSNAAETGVVAVVPARMGSSRYPGKPLVTIAGLPMVEHVRRRAALAETVDEVVVATCDREILNVVTMAGGRAVMTSDTHDRCTTRVAEAMESLAGSVVVIVQGDEPLLLPEVVDRVVAPLLKCPELECVNLLSPLAAEDDLDNPDIVKAMVDQRGFLLLLSRARVPYFRERVDVPVYRQTGIMALRAEFLREFLALPETPLERAESVDMLRVLEHGRKIFCVVVEFPTVGVDRPSDVAGVERLLREDPVQSALHGRITETFAEPSR
jgi:3-deoxy-manno-octulosonate cytidylyltransferase (CMP-KDO synthetase)